MQRRRDGRFALGRLGAALPGIPGLAQMIAHHDVLYRDLSDARDFFTDGSNTELAEFWPYVFGATGAVTADTAETYFRVDGAKPDTRGRGGAARPSTFAG